MPGHNRGTPAPAADARVSACGIFVSLDGPGGAGKSTTAALVRDQLAARGLRVCATAEPSRTPLGEMIRASTDTLGRFFGLKETRRFNVNPIDAPPATMPSNNGVHSH
jgi:Thymidylate kinase